MRRSPRPFPCSGCVNGEQALASVDSNGAGRWPPDRDQAPGLIVLDLNLPGTDGRDILRQIKQDATLKKIPIVVFTTSSNPKDIQDCYNLGVSRYIVKPIDYEQLKRDIQSLIDYWLEIPPPPP